MLLNVSFGRQDLESTFETYIAWGLLPEAYGNFGSAFGSIALGLAFGLICAWIENFSTHKLLLSLEGLISFSVLLDLMNSFEMVASVFVTSLFQGLIVLVAASLPFVERANPQRPTSPPA